MGILDKAGALNQISVVTLLLGGGGYVGFARSSKHNNDQSTYQNRRTAQNDHMGDIVIHMTGETYLVTGNYGEHVTAVRTVEMTNPLEWKVLSKAQHTETRM